MSLAHENLVAWQRADDLFIDLHQLTHQRFPRFERFELGQQIRRAGWSVPANIVEGIARGRGLDAIRFLKIARGSLTEVGYGLHACKRLGYITDEEYAAYQQRLSAIGGPLQGLINKRRFNVSIRSAGAGMLAFLALGATLF
jgi:four helix bundle protein